jgi:two-component system chemotaxis response regulator CheB
MRGNAAAIRTVLVGDHSAQCTELQTALQGDGDIAVLGQADNSEAALVLVAQLRPDVVILDLELADGGSNHTIEQLMAHTPTPILVLSALIVDRHSSRAAAALVSGALDALRRPVSWTPEAVAELRHTVRQISKVGVIRHPRGNRSKRTVQHPVAHHGRAPIVAIGASTGGPSALATLLAGLGGLAAPVLVVQHLHADFVIGLTEWMGRVSALPVEIAKHDQLACPGHVYLAPGGAHLRLGATSRFELPTAPPSLHRPAVDQLFESVAEHGHAGIGVLLTGMGDDGARGLLAIHRNGGQTFAQDEASCAVFGMPRAAQRLGAVTELHPLDQLAAAIQRAVAGVRA